MNGNLVKKTINGGISLFKQLAETVPHCPELPGGLSVSRGLARIDMTIDEYYVSCNPSTSYMQGIVLELPRSMQERLNLLERARELLALKRAGFTITHEEREEVLKSLRVFRESEKS